MAILSGTSSKPRPWAGGWFPPMGPDGCDGLDIGVVADIHTESHGVRRATWRYGEVEDGHWCECWFAEGGG